jgi:hypothetical protein
MASAVSNRLVIEASVVVANVWLIVAFFEPDRGTTNGAARALAWAERRRGLRFPPVGRWEAMPIPPIHPRVVAKGVARQVFRTPLSPAQPSAFRRHSSSADRPYFGCSSADRLRRDRRLEGPYNNRPAGSPPEGPRLLRAPLPESRTPAHAAARSEPLVYRRPRNDESLSNAPAGNSTVAETCIDRSATRTTRASTRSGTHTHHTYSQTAFLCQRYRPA